VIVRAFALEFYGIRMSSFQKNNNNKKKCQELQDLIERLTRHLHPFIKRGAAYSKEIIITKSHANEKIITIEKLQ
jgi:hypothetical protein